MSSAVLSFVTSSSGVGSHAARLIAEQGGRIVAVGDRLGGVSRPEGLDIPRLIEWVAGTGPSRVFRTPLQCRARTC